MDKPEKTLFTWEQPNSVTGQTERFALVTYSPSSFKSVLLSKGWPENQLPSPHSRLVSDLRARAKGEFAEVIGNPDTIYFWAFAMTPYYAKYS